MLHNFTAYDAAYIALAEATKETTIHPAWRTLQGLERMYMIRKGQVRWLPKNDIVGQTAFVGRLFGLTTA